MAQETTKNLHLRQAETSPPAPSSFPHVFGGFCVVFDSPARFPHEIKSKRGVMVLSPVPRIPYSIHVFYYNLIT